MFYVPDSYLENLLEEDLHLMDVTTAALGIENAEGVVECRTQRACVAAGIEEAARVFELAGAKCDIKVRSGENTAGETLLLEARGTAGQLHAAYKTAQNIMEYSSGIATRSDTLVKNARAASPDIEVCVSRKHFPGTKRLALKAALAGGARIHRLGLSDSVLVFDQHRAFLDNNGLIPLITGIKKNSPEKKIAAEANTPEEALSYAAAGVDIVQCERFTPKDLKIVVHDTKRMSKGITISAAGGINADNAEEYAETGVHVLVTSWVYYGKPEDIKMKFRKDSSETGETRFDPDKISIRKDKETGEVILSRKSASWGGFFKEMEDIEFPGE